MRDWLIRTFDRLEAGKMGTILVMLVCVAAGVVGVGQLAKPVIPGPTDLGYYDRLGLIEGGIPFENSCPPPSPPTCIPRPPKADRLPVPKPVPVEVAPDEIGPDQLVPAPAPRPSAARAEAKPKKKVIEPKPRKGKKKKAKRRRVTDG